MKVAELFEAADPTVGVVSVKDLGDGKFLVSCKETAGPTVKITAGIAAAFQKKRGFSVTMKSGLSVNFQRKPANGYIVKSTDPEAKQKLVDAVADLTKKAEKSIVRDAAYKAKAPERKKEASKYYSAQAKKKAEEKAARYGKKTWSRIKIGKAGGDDRYSYAVWVDGRMVINGQSLSSAEHERESQADRLALNDRQGIYADPKVWFKRISGLRELTKPAILKYVLHLVRADEPREALDAVHGAREAGFDFPEFEAIEKSANS